MSLTAANVVDGAAFSFENRGCVGLCQTGFDGFAGRLFLESLLSGKQSILKLASAIVLGYMLLPAA